MATAKKPLLERAESVGKFFVKWGAIGLAAAFTLWTVTGWIEPEKPARWDLSQRKEEVIQEMKTLSGGEWVPVTFPCYRAKGGTMWYQITASPHVEVEYDFLDGKPPRKDGPEKMLAVEKWPPVIKVRAKKTGNMELTLNRQFLPDAH